MKLQRPTLYTAVLVIATVGSGLLIGRSSGRWGDIALEAAAEQLRGSQFPVKAGSWHMKGTEQELDADTLGMVHCKSYLSRVYVHEQTGDQISVVVLLGPTGPISVHTPEVCYAAQDFKVGKKGVRVPVTDASGKHHEFWDVLLTSGDSAVSSQRVLYGWSTGGPWEASNRPRFGYAGAPYLYKLQLATGVRSNARSDNFDPCQDFLQSFLSQCQRGLLAQSRPGKQTTGREAPR